MRSEAEAEATETADIVCKIDNMQGMVDALSAVRWKRHQVLFLLMPPVGLGLVWFRAPPSTRFTKLLG